MRVVSPETLTVKTADIMESDIPLILPVLNVDYVADIPGDWIGVMGVPITYLEKHCKEQFDLLDISKAGGCDWRTVGNLTEGSSSGTRSQICRNGST